MASNEELEKRIETLEKELQHLKAVLQYQMRNKKKVICSYCIEINFGQIIIFSWLCRVSNVKAKN